MFIRTLSPGGAFAIFSWDDVSCQVGHAEPMMRAPGPLTIARVDEGPALTQSHLLTGLPMLICSRAVRSGPGSSTLADEVVGTVARSQKP
jgi:hypothetical protein